MIIDGFNDSDALSLACIGYVVVVVSDYRHRLVKCAVVPKNGNIVSSTDIGSGVALCVGDMVFFGCVLKSDWFHCADCIWWDAVG